MDAVIPTLVGERVTLRQGRDADLQTLAVIYAHPEVARWWPGEDAESLRSKIEQNEADVEAWVIEVEGRPGGLIQVYEQADPQYRHAGIDLALAPGLHGRGLGPEAIEVMVDYLHAQLGHHRVVIDPNAANARAVRACAKAGFRRVGVMRLYEWDVHLGR